MANENRLIDAHDLWTDIMMLPHNGDMISSEEVRQAIMDAPTVDAVKVVHGRWIKKQLLGCEPFYLCSVCGKLHYQDYNFCNNCGAKMDGDENG